MINIYVGNLPYSATDEDLNELFAPFGTVASAQVIVDRRSRRSRGYGFVEMENDADGRKAIESLNNTDFNGRALRVDESRPRAEKRSPESGRAPEARSSRAQRPARAPDRPGGVRGFLRRLFG